MASSINSTSAGNGGLVSTGDDSGILNIQTNETTAITVDASQRVAFVAGTAALPAITTTGDTNTGIFFPAADTIAFAEGGAESMRITSAGDVGIGTSSPENINSNYKHLEINGVTSGLLSISANGVRGLSLTADGSAANIQSRVSGQPLTFSTNNAGTNAERMRIDSSGRWMVGTTTALNGGVARGSLLFNSTFEQGLFIATSVASNGQCMGFNYNTSTNVGSINITSSATSYSTSSDYRLKENITPISGALTKVAQLKPVNFKWKTDNSDGQGFIAHELQEVCPDAVTGTKDATREEQYEVTPAVKDEEGNITTPAVMGTRTVPAYQSVDTSFLVATLTAAIQELKAINDTQAETINALTARIVALEQA